MAPMHITVKTATGRLGPHPSYIEVAKPYIFENGIHGALTKGGVTETRDDKARLEGIAYIDSVRRALNLPVRTYNTAAVYFHKFRLAHPENAGHYDAAAAALFAACKIEDTLKKSKEILCAASNLKSSPAERLTADDPIFEQSSKNIIGLERLMLEASGFDFRNRYPQRLLLKICRHHDTPTAIAKTAFNICLDLYRTFAPLKQTSATMAFACFELAYRLHEHDVPSADDIDAKYARLRVSRTEVMETMADVLDLYTNQKSSTLVGPPYPVDKFLGIRIALNQEASRDRIPSHSQPKSARKKHSHQTNGHKGSGKDAKKAKVSPLSPRDKDGNLLPEAKEGSREGKPGLKEGTVRFMLDAQRANDEKEFVDGYFRNVTEEKVVEVPVEERKNENGRGGGDRRGDDRRRRRD